MLPTVNKNMNQVAKDEPMIESTMSGTDNTAELPTTLDMRRDLLNKNMNQVATTRVSKDEPKIHDIVESTMSRTFNTAELPATLDMSRDLPDKDGK